MRDASTLLWQAIVFQLIAISYLLVSQDLAAFPHLLAAAVAALLLVCLSMLLARRLLVVAAAGSTVLGAALSLAGGVLVFYDLVFVVSPARIGMLGLVLAYLEGGLLGYAAHASLAAGRMLWRFRAVNPHFPQAGVAAPPAVALGATPVPLTQAQMTVVGHDSTDAAADGSDSVIERADPAASHLSGDAELRVLAVQEA